MKIFRPSKEIGETPEEQVAFYESYLKAERKKFRALQKTINTKLQRLKELNNRCTRIEEQLQEAKSFVGILPKELTDSVKALTESLNKNFPNLK